MAQQRETHDIETDVAIIGGGTAGLNSAMAAAEAGCRVLIVDKANIVHSGAIAGGIDHFMAYLETGARWDTREAYLAYVGRVAKGAADLEVHDAVFCDELKAALARTEKVHGYGGGKAAPAHFSSPETAVAVLRLSLFAGEAPQAVARWHSACRWMEWNELVDAALSTAFEPALLQRLHPQFRAHALATRLAHVLMEWEAVPPGLPAMAARPGSVIPPARSGGPD